MNRKDAKKQFDRLTKEHNIVHTFSFDEAWEWVEYKKNHIPIYLLGESFGGAVAIKYANLYHNISGLILLAPLCGFVNVINNCSISISCE